MPRVLKIATRGMRLPHLSTLVVKYLIIFITYNDFVDGFGEENPDQALAMLGERSLEFMLQGETSAIQHSGLELPDKSHDKFHDKTHDRSRIPLDLQMERISEHDVSMFGRVTGEGVLQVPEIDKEIPDIPEIPPPELPAPILQPEKARQVPDDQDAPTSKDVSKQIAEHHERTLDIELEELEDMQPQPKRRRIRNRLIIDKNIKLSGNFIRSRIENPNVELRCEDSWDDIVQIRTPCEVYFGRPCHAGSRVRSNISYGIYGLFVRNLGVINVRPLAEREMEEIRERPYQLQARSVLERIEEVEEPIHDRTQAPQVELPSMDITNMSLLHVTAPRVSEPMPDIDPSELPTQKLETLSQQARKRTAEQDIVTTPKRQRSIGYVSFRLSQQLVAEVNVPDTEAEKENIPVEHQSPVFRPRRSTVLQETSQIQDVVSKEAERSVTAMLQEAGLADMQINPPQEIIQPTVTTRRSQRHRSESSETPLGSLDRTKVSLGDSEQTTDSQRFIRDQWGTEGTMVKILKTIKAELMPVTVKNLINKGPVIPGHKKLIAARCFTSMLKLKQHGFISFIKNPNTLEIEGVTLGPKFD